jgi:hypothetical protein
VVVGPRYSVLTEQGRHGRELRVRFARQELDRVVDGALGAGALGGAVIGVHG